ncbi:uncharacterized protein EAE98_009952 [Botrytis deweyae]|uniref:BTB domain-containing protein n=1 Tax=Botrytis deweyae TaxID=2478750 RepID=A0ABQ7I9Z5_9HELO|nr:uncharacterized protein EAE98_009952 [Botrytis deweyae]KAF7917924.1 hypothetical protein EAE98_009952 [Botrytis deweyae]
MPPAKKRKLDREEKGPESPTVHTFHLPGHKVDVKLSIFDGLQLHVHSVILKLHSAFFRRFLDSPGKDGKDENTGSFKYEWATVYDDDGSWSLFDTRNIKHDNPSSDLMPKQIKRSQKLHEAAFINFIGTFYGKLWVIKNTEALQLVTELADYYCALPAVSKSMHGAFSISPEFCKGIFFSNKSTLLDLALKLRSPELFRECMICLVGRWQDSTHEFPIESQLEMLYNPKLANPKLNELAIKLHRQICVKISAAQRKIVSCCQVNSNALEIKAKVEQCYLERIKLGEGEQGVYRGQVSLPEYFQAFGEESSGIFALAVSDILKNELIFNKSLRAGDILFPAKTHDDVQSYFLCAEIKDEDLPWDLNKTDW